MEVINVLVEELIEIEKTSMAAEFTKLRRWIEQWEKHECK